MMAFNCSNYYLKNSIDFFTELNSNFSRINAIKILATAVAHYHLWKFLGTVSVDVDDDYALM
jgi:predicted SprT family Zn-dependent metalloprotease